MMSFKEILQEDVKSVFLNFDEFAELAIVNGKEMLIIQDTLEYENRERLNLDRTERLYQKNLLIYVAAKDFGPEPKNGSQLQIESKGRNRLYEVEKCSNEDGIYAISLRVFK